MSKTSLLLIGVLAIGFLLFSQKNNPQNEVNAELIKANLAHNLVLTAKPIIPEPPAELPNSSPEVKPKLDLIDINSMINKKSTPIQVAVNKPAGTVCSGGVCYTPSNSVQSTNTTTYSYTARPRLFGGRIFNGQRRFHILPWRR